MVKGDSRATKWGKADKAKFKLLVDTKKINWKRNDTAYLRQIRDKHWPGRKTPTFRANWKATTGEFRTDELLNGARSKLEGGKFCIFFALPFLLASDRNHRVSSFVMQ